MRNEPLVFTPILKTRVWGGDILKSRSPQPPPEPVGESWEIADCGDTATKVASGTYAGRTLHELAITDRHALCGKALDPACPDRFPLLLKLLDAQDDLSLQVHPPDQAGQPGKTEAWYVLSADRGACIYCGFQPGATAEAFARVLRDSSAGKASPAAITEMLCRLPAEPGRFFYLPAGTVHALGKGVQVAEIQQNSDTTYRLYDWGRIGLDGKPRELHVEQALAVASFAGPPPSLSPQRLEQDGCERLRLLKGAKFTVEILRQFRGRPIRLDTEGKRFHILTVIRGSIEIQSSSGSLRRGRWDSALVPAAVGEYAFLPDQDAEALLFYTTGDE